MNAATTTQTAECAVCGECAEVNKYETCRKCYEETHDLNMANDFYDAEGADLWQVA